MVPVQICPLITGSGSVCTVSIKTTFRFVSSLVCSCLGVRYIGVFRGSHLLQACPCIVGWVEGEALFANNGDNIVLGKGVGRTRTRKC